MTYTHAKEPKTFGKTIIIVEGVAGAGKTTFTSAIEEVPGVGVVRASLGKRQFEKGEASIKSQINDWGKLVSALIDPNPVVLIERLVLSQAVYGSLRLNSPKRLFNPNTAWSAVNLIGQAIHDYEWRNNHFPGREYFFGWFVIAPHPHVIRWMRQNGGKEYPNPPDHETYLYRQCARELVQFGENVIMPDFNSPINLEAFQDVFHEWVLRRAYDDVRGLFFNLSLSQQ